MRKTFMRPLAFVASAALVIGVAGTALAADPDWATVTGYAPATEDNNHPETWGENCEDIGVSDVDTFELPALGAGMVYSLVVVKAGSEASDGNNTLFANPSAGQTVWADSNESGAFDEGDKQISHIIVCTEEGDEETPAEETPAEETPAEETPAEETPAGETPGEEETPEGSVAGGTGTPAPSQPDTAMGAQGGPSPIPTIAFAMILLAALGTLAWANIKTARNRA